LFYRPFKTPFLCSLHIETTDNVVHAASACIFVRLLLHKTNVYVILSFNWKIRTFARMVRVRQRCRICVEENTFFFFFVECNMCKTRLAFDVDFSYTLRGKTKRLLAAVCDLSIDSFSKGKTQNEGTMSVQYSCINVGI